MHEVCPFITNGSSGPSSEPPTPVDPFTMIISADSRGPFGGNPTWSSIAYVRCEPLTKSQLRTIKEDCEKILIATNDGECVTHCKSEDDIKEFIEPFRDSDFGDIYWGIVGEFATHPTAIGIERYRKLDPDSGGSGVQRVHGGA